MRKATATFFMILSCMLSVHAQLLWKVEGPGLKAPSYILGTCHLAPASFADSIPGLKEALDASQQVYGELEMSVASNPDSVSKMQRAMTLPQGQSLDSLLTSAQRERLNEFMRKYLGADMSHPMMSPMKQMSPGALAIQFQMLLSLQVEKHFNSQELFDNHFQQMAKEQGKTTGGLETLDTQVRILYASTSTKRQVEQLMCLVDDADYMKDLYRRTMEAFYTQSLPGIEKVLDEKRHNTCDATPEEENALMYGRNAAWAAKLPALMQGGSTFVAVGVGHLPGERGLLSLLRKQGYAVSPVTR